MVAQRRRRNTRAHPGVGQDQHPGAQSTRDDRHG
jgi:hypothetical protein